MNVWTWVGVSFGALLLLSCLIGVAVARILGDIAAGASELLEMESWASAPLARDKARETTVELGLATARDKRSTD
jgi:hypothetical protein